MKRARKLTAIIMAAVLMLSMMTVNVFANAAYLPAAIGIVEELNNTPGGLLTSSNHATANAAILHINTLLTAQDTVTAYVGTLEITQPTAGIPAQQGNPVVPGQDGLIYGTVLLVCTYVDNAADPHAITLNIPIPALPIGGAGGTHVVDGQGNTVFLDTTVFDFILPTTASFNFVLDPLGIVNAIPDTDTGVVVPTAPGRILPASPGAQALNLSSVPMNLSVTYSATATDAELFIGGSDPRDTVVAGIELTADAANRFSTEARAILDTSVNRVGTTPQDFDSVPRRAMLYLVPRRDSGITYVGPSDGATDPWSFVPGVGASYVEQRAFVVPGTAGTPLVFRLDAADYQIVYAAGRFVYELVDDDLGVGTEFQVGGFVNRFANWARGSVSLGVTFTFEAAELVQPAADFDVDNVAFLQGNNVAAPTNLPRHIELVAADAAALALTARQTAFGPRTTIEAPVGWITIPDVPMTYAVNGVTVDGVWRPITAPTLYHTGGAVSLRIDTAGTHEVVIFIPGESIRTVTIVTT